MINLLSIVFIPITGSLVLPVVGRFWPRLRNLLAFVFVFIPLFLSLASLPMVLGGKTFVLTKELPLGLNFVLCADSLAVFMAIVSSLISAVIIFYSFSYISHYRNENEYYSMVVLFLGAMMGIVFSGNLIFLYLFWEITAIVSWRLIGFFRAKTDVLAADKSFLVTVFGALLMLIGFVSIYAQTGSFDIPVIKERFSGNGLAGFSILMILAGIFSKSATLPFHTWLPDAGVAPSPVTALLHAAVLVKIGVYVYARLFVASFDIGAYWQSVVLITAGISALVSAAAALVDKDLKRIIAYSTVSQIGFIFFGLASGNLLGISGGLIYILMHGLSKAGLFLCAGIIEQNTKTKDITKLGGLIRTMPLTAVSFLFCAFSVMGIPPFGGFFGKYLVFAGALSGGRLIISAVFLLGAFLTILYLFRVFYLVFLGEEKIEAKEASLSMVYSVVLLAGFSLLGGILVKYPLVFVRDIVVQFIKLG